MTEHLDARGLSCPQPVFATQKLIWKMKSGVIEILVSDGTAKQNITRTAEREGWNVEVQDQEDGDYLLTLRKD